MVTLPDGSREPVAADSGSPEQSAVLSLLIPGLGQFTQRRFIAGTGHLGSVVTYAVTALALGEGRALLFAIAWNVWSAIDAYRHERRLRASD